MINKKKFRKQIVIGTAQLCTDYGIANFTKKKFSKKKIFNFLDYCIKNNFFDFDTAYGYSNEKVIGEFINKKITKKKINITSKIPSMISIPKKNKIKFINSSIDKTLNNLNYNLNTILFHDQRDIYFVLNNFDQIKNIIRAKKIKNIGFSIYDLKYYEMIKKKIKKDKLVIQLPINIINDKFIKKRYPKNFDIHVRSIFLQGLLVNKKIKKTMSKKHIILHKEYFSYLERNRINPFELCFDIFNKIDYKKFIIGFDDIHQIKYFLNLNKKKKNFFKQHILKIRKIFNKSNIEDPRKWA